MWLLVQQIWSAFQVGDQNLLIMLLVFVFDIQASYQAFDQGDLFSWIDLDRFGVLTEFFASLMCVASSNPKNLVIVHK